MSSKMKGKREGGFLIAKIHQLSQRIFAKLLKEYNIEELNPAQGRIMFVLWQKDKIPIHELVKRTQLTKSTLTSTLDRLEEAGFLKRVPSEEDRREILIELTDIEENLQKKYVDVSQEMNDLFYNKFEERERDEFEDYLRRLLNNLIKFEEKHH
jgi:DNA-binding MarR family transcriptional regulator